MEIRFKHIAFLLIIASICSYVAGDRVRASINRNRIDELTELYTAETNRNTELAILNRQHISAIIGIGQQLTDTRTELEEIRNTAGRISTGLGEDGRSIGNIIIRVRNIRESINSHQENSDGLDHHSDN